MLKNIIKPLAWIGGISVFLFFSYAVTFTAPLWLFYIWPITAILGLAASVATCLKLNIISVKYTIPFALLLGLIVPGFLPLGYSQINVPLILGISVGVKTYIDARKESLNFPRKALSFSTGIYVFFLIFLIIATLYAKYVYEKPWPYPN